MNYRFPQISRSFKFSQCKTIRKSIHLWIIDSHQYLHCIQFWSSSQFATLQSCLTLHAFCLPRLRMCVHLSVCLSIWRIARDPMPTCNGGSLSICTGKYLSVCVCAFAIVCVYMCWVHSACLLWAFFFACYLLFLNAVCLFVSILLVHIREKTKLQQQQENKQLYRLLRQ